MSRKWSVPLLIIFSLLGFFESIYLTLKDLTHTQVACSVISGCEQVLNSKYSHLGAIPVSALGVCYYLLILFLACLLFMHPNQWLPRIIKRLVPVGVLASGVFVALQLFVIKSICLYCFGSAILSSLIFFVGWYGLIPPKNKELIVDIKAE